MRVYKAMPELIHRLAHQWCEGRWVALGGGGYDIWRVVPRAWSLLWLVMSEQAIVSQLEAERNAERASVKLVASPILRETCSDDRLRYLERENFELGVQVASFQRENAAYQKIIDSIGQACSR